MPTRATRRPPPKRTPTAPRRSTSVQPQPAGVKPGNWIPTMPGRGWGVILRLYSPLEKSRLVTCDLRQVHPTVLDPLITPTPAFVRPQVGYQRLLHANAPRERT